MSEVIKSYKNDDIRMTDLVNILYGNKVLIMAVVLLSVIASVTYAITRDNIYRSEATLVAQTSGSSGQGTGQFGGIAAIAGISLGGGAGADKSKLALQIMTSRNFVTSFIEKHDLLVPLMATKGWDAESNKLLIDPDIYDKSSEQWVREYSYPQKQIPSLLEAFGEFVKVFKVSQDEKNGIILVSVEHYSPTLAKQLIDLLVEDINLYMKRRDVEEAEKSLSYLSKQLDRNIPQELKLTLYNLIEEKQRTLMLANVKDDYAFQIIDPAVIPEYRFKPNRFFIVLFSTLVSFMMICLFVIFRSINKRA